MEKKFEIFYVRHGHTDGDRFEDRDRCDVELSELGEKQARLLADRLEGIHFDGVFASPLVRAVRTAAIVCEKLDGHPEIELMPQIMENGSTYGYFGESVEYLGRYYDRVKLNTALPLMYGNVTAEDNGKRAKAAVDYFRERFGYGQRIIVFAHGTFGTDFISAASDLGRGNYILSFNNTSLSKVKYTEDGKAHLSFLNDFSHLRSLMPDYELTV